MLFLKENPSLGDIQKYVKEMELERGFDKEGILQKCLLLTEELGELCKAIRKQEHIHTDPRSHVGTIEEEIADIIIVLSAIANRCHIDMESAFRKKEEKNKQRTWVQV